MRVKRANESNGMHMFKESIDLKVISVVKLEECSSEQYQHLHSNNREYYKITLLKRRHKGNSKGNNTKVSCTLLQFLGPRLTDNIKFPGNDQTGFLCVFSKSFFTESVNTKLNALPMYVEDGISYVMNEEQEVQASAIFMRMLEEMDSHYLFKYDLLRNYISELTHFALKFLSVK